jgi:hypothetical protein
MECMECIVIELLTRPAKSERVLAQHSAETVILLEPVTGQYYTLDEVGARVWELCDGHRQVSDMVVMIHDEYDAPLETIRGDVLELLDDLAREQLVSVG